MSTAVTQVTFYLEHDMHESFSVPIEPEMFFQQLQVSLDSSVLVFQLSDQTVCIRTDKILKVEIEPPCPGITGSFLFANAERVTAMTRGSWRA